MPGIRDYNGGVPFPSLEPTDAIPIDRIGVGTGFIEGTAIAGGTVSAGAGIDVSGASPDQTVSNAGVISLTAGAGISLYGSLANETISATGIQSLVAGTNVSIANVNTISATGVQSLVAGTNVSITNGNTISASGGGGGSGALTLISSIVTSGSQATATFSAIPGTFTDLILVVRGASTHNAAFVGLDIQFNGDTGANYDYSQIYAFGGSVDNSPVNGATNIQICNFPGATGPANASGLVTVEIGLYAGTVFNKSVSFVGGNEGATNTSLIALSGYGDWRNTAAITSIEVFFDSSAFVNGSVLSLYGRQ